MPDGNHLISLLSPEYRSLIHFRKDSTSSRRCRLKALLATDVDNGHLEPVDLLSGPKHLAARRIVVEQTRFVLAAPAA